jgi:hypothetical protein
MELELPEAANRRAEIRYRKERKLGEGTYAVVYEGKYISF